MNTSTIASTPATIFLSQLQEMSIEDRLVLESQVFLENCRYFQQQQNEASSVRQFNKEIENLGFDKRDIKKRVQVAEAYEGFPDREQGTIASIGSVMLVTLANKNYVPVRESLREETDIFQLVAVEKMKEGREHLKQERQEKKAKETEAANIQYLDNGRVAKLPPIYSEDAIASLMRQEKDNVSATIVAEGIVYREEIISGLWVKASEVFKKDDIMTYSRTAISKLEASLALVKSYSQKIREINSKITEQNKTSSSSSFSDDIPFQETRRTLGNERIHWDKMREGKINQMIDYARACGIELDQLALWRKEELVFIKNEAI